jgi:hypothetical protein
MDEKDPWNPEPRLKEKPKEAVCGAQGCNTMSTTRTRPTEKNPEVEPFYAVNDKRAGVQENRGDMVDTCRRGEASKGDASRKDKTHDLPK